MIKTYIEQEKVELWVYAESNMTRNISNMSDKVELVITTREDAKRFQTTYKDLLTIMENADEKLSQSTKPEQD